MQWASLDALIKGSFMNSYNPRCDLQPFTIVGGGRVGEALAGMSAGTDVSAAALRLQQTKHLLGITSTDMKNTIP